MEAQSGHGYSGFVQACYQDIKMFSYDNNFGTSLPWGNKSKFCNIWIFCFLEPESLTYDYVMLKVFKDLHFAEI